MVSRFALGAVAFASASAAAETTLVCDENEICTKSTLDQKPGIINQGINESKNAYAMDQAYQKAAVETQRADIVSGALILYTETGGYSQCLAVGGRAQPVHWQNCEEAVQKILVNGEKREQLTAFDKEITSVGGCFLTREPWTQTYIPFTRKNGDSDWKDVSAEQYLADAKAQHKICGYYKNDMSPEEMRTPGAPFRPVGNKIDNKMAPYKDQNACENSLNPGDWPEKALCIRNCGNDYWQVASVALADQEIEYNKIKGGERSTVCPSSTATGSTETKPQPEDTPNESQCVAYCQSKGHCCNDYTNSTNQLLSCAQACKIRTLGASPADCKAIVAQKTKDKANDEGCNLTYKGTFFNSCGDCKDLTGAYACNKNHGVVDEKAGNDGCMIGVSTALL